MAEKIIKEFKDGSYLKYDCGNFDNYCVYYVNNAKGIDVAPKDMEYFNKLRKLGKIYGMEVIYNDFVRVYEKTTKKIDPSVLEYITSLSQNYGKDSLSVDVVFTILYMGMIAEENKKNTKLGKRIKRLGIHYLLMESKAVSKAANFMRGMKAYQIHRLCLERGF